MLGYFMKTYTNTNRIDHKTVLITGGNTGIGRETAKELYKRGARVLILSRNKEKSEKAIEEVKNECRDFANVGQLVYKHLDLNELSSVRKCAKEILQEESEINILINNAAVAGVTEKYTKDGFEAHFGVNYLGHFLLTLLLLPLIIKSKSHARIINVSSIVHNTFFMRTKISFDDIHFEKQKYIQWNAYAQSKLANVMFTKELAKRLKKANIYNVSTYSLHPGIVATEIGRNSDQFVWGFTWLFNNFSKYILLTPQKGAQTTIYCALDEKLQNETGLYYSNSTATQPSEWAFNNEALEKLWKMSEDLVKLDKNYNPFGAKYYRL